MLQIIVIIILVAADQLTKFLLWPALASYPDQSMTVIPNVLNFTQIKNSGASFGIFQGAQVFFVVVTIFVLIVAGYFMVRYRQKLSRYLNILIAVLFAGALGNLIDRAVFGYVRDFIDFRLFDFWKWVFNIADASLVVGGILLAVYLLFFYKDKKAMKHADTPSGVKDGGGKDDDDHGVANE